MNEPVDTTLRQVINRRWFLAAVRRRAGRVALRFAAAARPRARPRLRRPIRCRPSSRIFTATGQARHLSVHGRAPEPSGPVRLQAAAAKSSAGSLPPAELLKGYRAAFINPQLEVPGARNSSSPSTASAARRFPSCCRTWPTVVDDVAIVRSLTTDAFNHAPARS